MSDTTILDSMPLVYKSVEVFYNGTRINSGFSVNHSYSLLICDSSLRNRNIFVYFRVIDMPIKSEYAHRQEIMIEPVFSFEPKYLRRIESNTNNSLFNDGMNVNGNLARGLGFGNNQDVVLNSNLNLQMSGKLGKGFSLLAAISDENNPIQPQGNTQQIQDFDKVFISILKDSSSLTVGDFLMQTTPRNYFMKYYKKSRGMQLDYKGPGKFVQHLHADAAVSRGKFFRNEIQGQEGMQGPYRLQGANGELNIIVISATEVVYLDGEKLERGQQNDYVIDYNTGEMTFMPKRLINKFNRIVVEFQYSDRNYSRSVFTFSDEFRTGHWFSSVSYFSEQDNKLQASDTSNKNDIQAILESAGDEQAIYKFERKFNQFQLDRVNYRKIDSLGFTIYLYTNIQNSDTVFYSTSFSLVGPGKGNYIQIATSANGRVYAWVEPVNGIPSGNYEPYIELVAPKRLQMLTANTLFTPNRHFEMRLEGAYTNFNQNTFSSLDKKNDDGLGMFFSLKHKDFEFRDFLINTQMKVEFINRNFRYVERYRTVEFNRLWNRQLNNNNGSVSGNDELISTFRSEVQLKKKHSLSIEGSNYTRGELFSGLRGYGNYKYSGNKLFLNIYGEKMHTSEKNLLSVFENKTYLYRFESNYQAKGFKTGASALAEESRFTNDTTPLLGSSSFRYQQVSAFIQSFNKQKLVYKLESNFRTDFSPTSENFSYTSSGLNVNGNLEHVSNKLNRLNLVGSFRQLNLAGKTNDDQVILGRLEYNASFFKKIVSSSTYYQIGTGREQKRQFSFALVQAGNGTHTWIDYNGNGIEEINEFELAVYKDQARYVKIFLPTNEFIKSNTNEFNQTIRIQAPTSWQSANSLKRFVTRFNTVTSYKADRRITDNSLITILNPFKLDVVDSSLIAVNSLIKQTTFFNRSNSKFGIEHTIQTNKGKQFLSSGFEWKSLAKHQVITRFGFTRSFNLVINLEQNSKENKNEFFENRNFKYVSRLVFPEFFYQNIKGIRVGTYYKYTEAFNAPEYGNDQAYINEFGLELRYFIINKGNIDARIASHQINYKGNLNTPLAFDVLNGLSNGSNLTWNIGFGGKTKGNIQFNLSYEGRKTEVFKTIHIGRAEARYIF